MKAETARALQAIAQKVATLYGNQDREKNYHKETFTLVKIKPLSELTALGIYIKDVTNKVACVFFYYIEPYKEWRYFIPKDSHLLGMLAFPDEKKKAEEWNYEKNFDNEKGGEYE